MGNIEKIKAEIKRLKKILEKSTYYLDNSQQALGYSFALDDLEDFIDSLPEETCKESLQVQETCKENPDSFTNEPKEMSVDEAMKYIDEKIAKTRSSKSWEGVDVDKFMDEIRGREPDDLEEAADEYAISLTPCDQQEELNYFNSFIAGAKWQAKQFLKGSPLPEDTILFQKGVEEGRRLEREDGNDDNLPRLTKDYYYGG